MVLEGNLLDLPVEYICQAAPQGDLRRVAQVMHQELRGQLLTQNTVKVLTNMTKRS